MIYLYETLCLISSQLSPEEKERGKKEFIQKIKSIITPENLEIKNLKGEDLFYQINKDDYLLLNLKVDSQGIKEVEKALRNSSFISQYILINLNKEPKIKQRKVRKNGLGETSNYVEQNWRKKFD